MTEVVLAASAANILVWIVWILAALALLASGLAVVLFANPFYSALALIGNLASLAILYLLLSTPSSSPPRRCSSTRAPSWSCSCS